MRYVAIAVTIVALAGCAPPQTFTDIAGSVRISAKVERSLMDLEHATLSLHLTDVSTGYPIDASEIAVRISQGQTLSAKRGNLGSYSATLSDSDKIDVLVRARGETALLSLKRR